MLKINNVSYSYSLKGHKVLDDFSLSLSSGGVYGLLGPNGAGKSTLLNIIAGTLTLSHGNVTLDGTDTRRRLPVTLTDIFFVPEEFSLPPMKLSKYARLYGAMYPRFSEDDMKRYLEMFELPSDVRLDALSMGQKKKVFMSFAMACNTRVLLMDEPTNGLDIPAKSRFRKFIVSGMTDDRTIIISTHQVRDIDKLLDHVVITDPSGIKLDADTYSIISKLKFITAPVSVPPTEALFAQPALGGYNLILNNDDDTETEINLESLFEFTQRCPEKVAELFTSETA